MSASTQTTAAQTAAPGGSGRRTLRLAHRGDHRAAPENTREAFRAALGSTTGSAGARTG